MGPKACFSLFPLPSVRAALGHEAKADEILTQYQWLSLYSGRTLVRQMRWLVIDSSCNTRHQRTPGILRLMLALQEFVRLDPAEVFVEASARTKWSWSMAQA